MVVGAARRESGAGRARTQALSVQPLSARAGGAFGTGLPLCIMCICRVVFSGPRCLPVGHVHDVHGARPVFQQLSDSVRAGGRA